jgi:cytoplasmic iron level regulating protein YaaA (DUF328/UPF0246 family)
MKIIVSPSKTQDYTNESLFTDKKLLFPDQTKELWKEIKALSKENIQTIMKIKGNLLEETYQTIQDNDSLPYFQALTGFTGLVFKQLHLYDYSNEQVSYIENHVRILDALHGVLEPGTLIKPYRLDMKMKIHGNLYKYWNVSPYFKDETVINLASDEFSKMIQSESMITISFLQDKDGVYKSQATYSKMARGMLLDYMIQENIDNPEAIKKFNKDGYTYKSSLSSDKEIVFTR